MKVRFLTPGVSLSFGHHAGVSMILLGSTPILRENTLGLVRGLTFPFPFHQPPKKICGSTHTMKISFIYKHPFLLGDWNPGSMTPQSASQTTRPDRRLKAYDQPFCTSPEVS
ncbi:hypothetical protein TNCV_4229061 [Trichonephila clavipes]|nr:hypothetical protein TNCV_4229061 [Trichonephila clavipes]